MRVKGGVNSKKKKRKYLKAAKGYRGALSRRYRLAKQYYIRSGVYAYVGRKQKKRDFRKLWITRINAAARMEGIKYSELIHGLKLSGVNINRKMLADLAVNDFEAFKEYVALAKEALGK
ncbi:MULTISPECIES: 50S ribosomal protein L20 [Kosmotoga]|jgi:large subunit ribosomal protein L20|uniref:Large ribosomal subunit protein bL20 n=1 Tax=Kosmotoga olearia (strain ATCC BAA-1733 / DSM 21960 / TBF 19.5.1) TaxID=521045 RepID=RL20_KOSOT|nr:MULTISPECIES: 50S ribosomal protein L20 [Kosmotoga]C5CE41.1 RecName: Full=Large ribosomal subunit protein bL20; AltName: Full=50S ribosomal protein L20 [Kosmotoga olearia TBF 19.5.1]ACR80143.1 ribosomal protein L20 [Kosmotoga olearia TBF 19.5.1]MDI3523722.1 large subunit ribosomal protein [Kosmotoga sp.]MDK2953218.1 large subunit ribosomal protein [Kosmotoga sp.]OAA20333.1 50S ribosomal protein L20 [Kosmotoga sp. DU53]